MPGILVPGQRVLTLPAGLGLSVARQAGAAAAGETIYYIDVDEDEINSGADATISDLFDADVTIEAWSFIDDNTRFYNSIAGQIPPDLTEGWLVRTNGDNLTALINFATTDVSLDSGNALSSTTWFHWALTFVSSSGSAKLWLDGSEAASGTASGAYVPPTFYTDLIWASAPSGWGLVGGIGWMRVSDTVRYTGSFTPTARCSPPASDGNTLLLYRLTEGSGNPADSSSNGNDGTLTGASATWTVCS